jgi:hypothetical protein
MTPDAPQPDEQPDAQPGLTALEQEVVDRIDATAVLDDLAAMVALRPVGGAPGEAAVQQWAAGRLGSLGLDVDTWEVDLAAEAADPGYPGMEVARQRMLGVVGTWGGASSSADARDDSPGLVLCGHTDVVPPGDLARWQRDPFELVVEDGVARGRGVCDMPAASRRSSVPWRRSRPSVLRWTARSPCTWSAVRRTAGWVRSRPCAAATTGRPASSPNPPAER